MKLQGPAALRFTDKPVETCPLVLIFGEDEGVVTDAAARLIASWQRTETMNVITLDEDEVRRDPTRFFDTLEAQSLLGDTSILRVRTKGEKLFALLKDVLAFPHERIAAKLIIQNGSLTTRSKMRTAFEQADIAAALHVFADTSRDIIDRVKSQLAQDGIEIEARALEHFVGGLPGNRSLANAEIEKLNLYAYDLSRPISTHDIRILCETNADESTRQAVYLALSGESLRAQAELDRVLDAGVNAISLVRAFEMEVTRMLTAHALQNQSGANTIGMKLKPPVWKSDWPAFQNRLHKWPPNRLLRLMERLHDLEKATKSPGGSAFSEAGLKDLFVSCYSAASKVKA